MFQTTVSLGDLVVCAVAIVSGAGTFFANKARVESVEYKVEELRRGRGIILEHFPPMVRRCFGYMPQTPGE
jgi:hypothetical protein